MKDSLSPYLEANVIDNGSAHHGASTETLRLYYYCAGFISQHHTGTW